MGQNFSAPKFKVNLKMSVQRMNLLTSKKTNALRVTRREIAKLIADGKTESAEIKVEGVIREQRLLLAMEKLALHVELLIQRVQLLASQRYAAFISGVTLTNSFVIQGMPR
jgi:vacuolar protein sorting-associated protein IST1